VAHGKVQILKKALRLLKGIANLPWVANELSNPQSLTHSVVACGPIWLCAFGPAVLHGCTPLLYDNIFWREATKNPSFTVQTPYIVIFGRNMRGHYTSKT